MQRKYVFINLKFPITKKEISDYDILIMLYSDKNTKIIYGDKENYYNFLRSNENADAIYIHKKEQI